MPILLADYTTRIIGVTHAGWRGAKAGIISNTINTMIGLGATLENIQAAIGPCIAQKSYEVGPEIFQTFTEAYPKSSRLFIPSQRQGHYLFDLPGFVQRCLNDAGINNIESLNLDTYANPDLFFSCRRANHKQEPNYGCSLSAITLCD